VDLYYGDVREFVVRQGECGGQFFLTLRREGLNAYALAELFEDIVLGGNDALANSPKLYETIRGLVFAPNRERTARGIEEYFRHNSRMCVEGYLNFRLPHAAGLVNNALYSLARACRRTQGETYDN